VTCSLKARIVYLEKMSVTRQWHKRRRCFLCGPGPHQYLCNAAIEELWEVMFSVSLCSGHISRIKTQLCQSRVVSLQLAVGRQTHWRLSHTVVPDGGMGGGRAPIVVSRSVAGPSGI
jgi:hypothetical protein